MILEPPGSQASWNTRDQHMIETIMRINTFMENMNKDARIIIWAHNSHVGDSSSTERGGETFVHNNTWNLGQMARQMFGNTKIIGFYTNSGTVTASDEWGQDGRIFTLNKAIDFSYEYFFSKISIFINMSTFYIVMQKENTNPEIIQKLSKLPQEFIQKLSKLPQEFICTYTNKVTETSDINSKIIRNMNLGDVFTAINRKFINEHVSRLQIKNGGWITENNKFGNISLFCEPQITFDIASFFNFPRLQRWIGVNYKKDTELQSHYGHSKMGMQFDIVVYVDKTNSLDTF